MRAIFVVIGLLIVGCAGASTEYKIRCKDAHWQENYRDVKLSDCGCPEQGVVAMKKGFWGYRTYLVSDCDAAYRVVRWKRIRGQK